MPQTAQQRLEALNLAADHIKAKFYGADLQIDQFKDYIAPWYVAPNLITRPLVICLWGLTGVGKTQTIRSFIEELNLANICRSIVCSSELSESSILNAISDVRMESKLSGSSNEGIIFLDEFQNVTTRGFMGSRKEKRNNSIWDILSTGKIMIKSSRAEMMNDISSLRGALRAMKEDPRKAADSYILRPFSVYSANEFILQYNVKDKTIQEVMLMAPEERLKYMEKALATFAEGKPKYIDVSKTLFIIAGNMDQVFTSAGNVSSVEVDPEVVRQGCKDITLFDIKRGLGMQLNPEEVARLGNNHIVFYSISREGYQKIIVDELERLKETYLKASGITITWDKSVYEVLYKNGVFPTQGARPTFSAIQGMIESNLPKILFAAATTDKAITIAYDSEKHGLVTNNNQFISCIGPVDEVETRLSKEVDDRRCTAVHESGHALVYAELFNAIPSAMVSIVADSYLAAGYISTHQFRHTRVTIHGFIATAVAGMVAEEVVFGKDFRTVGCTSDLVTATTMAAKYVRTLAYTDAVKAVVGPEVALYNNMADTSEFINKMVKDCIQTATDIIHSNIDVLKDISEVMFEKKRLTPDEFKAITDKHGKKYKIVPFNAKITPNFNEMYEAFKNSDAKDNSEIATESVKMLESFYGSKTGVQMPSASDKSWSIASEDGMKAYFGL